MRSTIDDLVTRRSIRAFNDRPIAEEDLQLILKAGMYSASGQGKQSAIMVVVQNPADLEQLEKLNSTVVGSSPDRKNFFGAKTVIVVLADRNVATHVYDGSLVMGNLMNAAHALGIGSCWIHRAKQTFESEEGQALLDKWGIEGDYEGIGNCILGYYDESPQPKERKENWVYRV